MSGEIAAWSLEDWVALLARVALAGLGAVAYAVFACGAGAPAREAGQPAKAARRPPATPVSPPYQRQPGAAAAATPSIPETPR